MISQKLKNIFILSISVFIAHGLEEYFTGFYRIDPSIQNIFGRLGFNLDSTFLVFQIVFWLLLIVGFILTKKLIWPKTLLFMLGLIMFYEFYHVYKAILVGGYYPGLYTALFFPVLSYFFWKELINNFKRQ